MAKKMRKDALVVFSYKEVKTLLRYISPVSGQIEPISKTGLSAKLQRMLAREVKRARHLALLPFVTRD